MRDISKLSAKRQRKIILKLGENLSKGLRHGINKTLEQVEEKINYEEFYNYIKHLVKNGNADNETIRRKIEEMEEGVIYTDGTAYYKIQNNSIFHKTKGKIEQVWTLSGYNDYLNFYNKFRELEKVEEKRYNLILQKGYIKLFDLQNNEKYLTMAIDDGTVFNSKYSTDNSKYQAQFTLEEIEEIKKKYDIDLCIYEIVEVQE